MVEDSIKYVWLVYKVEHDTYSYDNTRDVLVGVYTDEELAKHLASKYPKTISNNKAAFIEKWAVNQIYE